jgi:hypothetical protein
VTRLLASQTCYEVRFSKRNETNDRETTPSEVRRSLQNGMKYDTIRRVFKKIEEASSYLHRALQDVEGLPQRRHRFELVLDLDLQIQLANEEARPRTILHLATRSLLGPLVPCLKRGRQIIHLRSSAEVVKRCYNMTVIAPEENGQ